LKGTTVDALQNTLLKPSSAPDAEGKDIRAEKQKQSEIRARCKNTMHAVTAEILAGAWSLDLHSIATIHDATKKKLQPSVSARVF
jgi:hypothetical protein